MTCVVTAGATWEPLDQVRRLTNFSTGRLGTELAGYLSDAGHEVILLLAETATYAGERRAQRIESFSTTESLRERLVALTGHGIEAVFHAAAVSDFKFGKVWSRGAAGELMEMGKLPTRQGALLAELVPTPKIISGLRGWFPQARLVGWKYEVEGSRGDVLTAARRQMAENLTDACVANGPAYGAGFGLVTAELTTLHLPDRGALFESLERIATNALK